MAGQAVAATDMPPEGGSAEETSDSGLDRMRGGDVPMAMTDGPSASPEATQQISEAIEKFIPDPEGHRPFVQGLLAAAETPKDRNLFQLYLDLLDDIRRPQQVRLALADAIRLALEHSFAIRVSGYQPAIDAARVVEAEAAFDAVYFFDFTNDKQDFPSAQAQLTGTERETRIFDTGVRKLLATGAQVEFSYNWQRLYTNLGFQTLNPAYTQFFAAQIGQPLLRGFGLDVNRAQINIRRNDRRISEQQFRRQVRDTLQRVEDAYWRLVQARRAITVQAQLVARTQDLNDTYEARLGFDVYEAQVAQIRSQLESRKADFVRALNAVRDAEDELKRLINDPALNLAETIEIIPTDVPQHEPFVLDRLSQIKTALENRTELKEAKLSVENARINVGVAKNRALPRLDVTFRSQVNALGVSSDQAFREFDDMDFIDYQVGVSFEWPIGNRGARAVWRQARLQYAQATTRVRQLIEDVVADVNTAIRRLVTEYDQIAPRARSAASQLEFLNSIRARETTKSPEQLNTELSAQGQLASEQLNLLQALVDYNRAIIDLERAKETLLQYNNVHLEDSIADPDAWAMHEPGSLGGP